MPETAWSVDRLPAVAARADAPRHTALVRVTHWLTTVCFLALLVSGLEIVVSHPRFYWGESGNVLTPALFSLPIPSSRATVPTGFDFVLPDQNGWSRYLHFEAAWVLVLTGAVYVLWGCTWSAILTSCGICQRRRLRTSAVEDAQATLIRVAAMRRAAFG
jgi:thiosulfate reductase cytochrome b subunit